MDANLITIGSAADGHRRGRHVAAGLLAVAAVVTACTGGSSPVAQGPADTPKATAASSTAPTTAPTPAIAFIEDTGLEQPIPAGTYESRVFRPELKLQLDGNWMRRDDVNQLKLNLRRLPGGEDVTFVGRVDFLQCGDAAVVKSPTTGAILAALTGSKPLSLGAPTQVTVGGRPGSVLRFPGGEAISEDLSRALDYGCVLSTGDVPFPAESAWTMATRDQEMQLVLVDVDGTPVLIRARPGTDPSHPDSFYDLTLKLIENAKLG